MQNSVANRMMSLFSGFMEAHGTHGSSKSSDLKSGKQEIKATARTLREPVTSDVWEKHLKGERALGIIPIRADGTCFWGCIDVDKYDISLGDIAATVEKLKLPIRVCRSKSGGAHLFLFFNKAVPADLLQNKLREIASKLGVGGSEIFPKQQNVLLERGDLGNWLNMPYFGGDSTERWGVKPTGLAMTLNEFIEIAENSRVSPDFISLKPESAEVKDKILFEGPPCLEHLISSGFPEGSRNKGLFALGVYVKKRYAEKWQEKLEEMNRQFMKPPLPAEEVVQVTRSLEKKEYQYTCNDWPLSSHCNSALCRTRIYGVGNSDEFPVISGLSLLDSEPPLWFLDISGERIEMVTEELQNYRSFHKICMEKLLVCYKLMKQETWLGMVAAAMKNVQRIEIPKDVGLDGQFKDLLEDFCMNRHKGQSVEDILLGRPWEDEENKRHYFRMRDLAKFLDAAGFKYRSQIWIAERIRQLGGGHKFFNIKGKGVNTWWVPSLFIPIPKLGLPEIDSSPF